MAKLDAKTAYPELDSMEIARHLGGMVTYKTMVNKEYAGIDWSQFEGFQKYLRETYPLTHEKLELTMIGGYTMLFRWQGSGKSGKKPVLFMAHQDVVPVTPGTEGDWEHDPFGGEIIDGFAWGRGSTDCKSTLCLTLEAVEYLLKKGFVPDRDIYLEFGHDEEVGGEMGAGAAARYCEENGIQFDAVFDEGPGFNHGEGIDVGETLLYTVNTFEKGYLDLEIAVNSKGGHSSKPEEHTALGDLARAIVKVEDRKFPADIPLCVQQYLEAAGPYIQDEELRTLCADVVGNKEKIMEIMMRTPTGCAMMRTTTAATMAAGSPAPNVLPQRATAIVNFRLNPSETVESVVEYVREAIGDDSVELTVLNGKDPSNMSSIDSEAFAVMKKTVNAFFPEAVVVPLGSLGGTDSRRFETVCPHVYRLSPINNAPYKKNGYTSGAHGTNEKAVVESLAPAAALYIELMKNLCTQEGRAL